MAKRTNMRTGKAASTGNKRGRSGAAVTGFKTGAGLRARKEGAFTPSAGSHGAGAGAYGQTTRNRIGGLKRITGVPVGNTPRGKGDAAAGRVGSHGQKTIKRSGKPSRLRG